MNKNELLKNIQLLASQRDITKKELLAAFEIGQNLQCIQSENKAAASKILGYIGGTIVFIGVVIFIYQHWGILSDVTKITSTLGVGAAAYIVAVLFSQEKKYELIGNVFYFIAALVIPLGLHVTFDIAGFNTGSSGIQSIISGILFVIFLLTFLTNRKTLFVLFNIIFASWFFFSFTDFLVSNRPNFDWTFSAYRVLCCGLSYGFLGNYFADTSYRSLTRFLYGLGTLGFLGAAFALGNYKPHQNIFWEIVFPGLTFSAMFISIRIKSKGVLVLGSLFIVAYIFKITSEYFSKSLGWPLVLVLTGLGLIAVGYIYFNFKRKYF